MRSPRCRAFDYERIYLRPASCRQAEAVVAVLQALVEHLIARPDRLPAASAGDDPVRAAVTYVAGMTDRFACRRAVEWLDWPPDAAAPRRRSAARRERERSPGAADGVSRAGRRRACARGARRT